MSIRPMVDWSAAEWERWSSECSADGSRDLQSVRAGKAAASTNSTGNAALNSVLSGRKAAAQKRPGGHAGDPTK